MIDVAEKWNERYLMAQVEDALPVKVVAENMHLLPASGNALDLGCGLGANAIMLASHGLKTYAWDISHVAIDKLDSYATRLNLPLHAEVRDVESIPPEAGSFDVIVVTHFLERKLTHALITALRPGGLLLYQTFIRDKTNNYGPSNPNFTLAQNELLHMFSPLNILVYREEGTVGDVTAGFRNEALLVAIKPL